MSEHIGQGEVTSVELPTTLPAFEQSLGWWIFNQAVPGSFALKFLIVYLSTSTYGTPGYYLVYTRNPHSVIKWEEWGVEPIGEGADSAVAAALEYLQENAHQVTVES